MPIFQSPSVHGYDVQNYYMINSSYGTAADFTAYVNAAHARGINVMLDMVINHSSSQNSWFLASQTNDPVYGSWYCWTNDTLANLTAAGWQTAWNDPTNTVGSAADVWYGSDPYYYAAFGSGMPDLNLKNPSVISEVEQIAGYWLTNGADSYRLDAVRYYDEDGPGVGQRDSASTYAFICSYEAALRSMKADTFTIGEAATQYADSPLSRSEATYYQNGSGIDMSFSFDFPGAVTTAIDQANASSFNYLITGKPSSAPFSYFAPLLDDHDSYVSGGFRLMDNLGNDFNKAKLAAALQLTFPGTPFVYYGTEIGMMSITSGDSEKRTPMQWDNTANAGFTTGSPWYPLTTHSNPYNVAYQQSDPNSLLNLYKNLIVFRKANTAMTRGGIVSVANDNAGAVSYLRTGTNVSFLVVANLNPTATNVNLNFTGSGLSVGTTYYLGMVPFLAENTNSAVFQADSNTNSSTNAIVMYVSGSFNNWSLSANPMTLGANSNWTVSISLSEGSYQYKFDTGSWLAGQNWGASITNGLATATAGQTNNMSFTASTSKSYTFTFNQNTLVYSVQ